MSQLNFKLDDDRTGFEPGETIAVTADWSLQGAPDAIELRAVWNTVGKGTTDAGTEKSVAVGNPDPSESRRIEITLPAAPYSFSGKLASLVWALELVVIPTRESFRKEITIAPGATEILLYSADSTEDGDAQ